MVAVASRLQDALHYARVLDLDASVLDVNLAGQLSYPVADVLRERAVPFLFATGYGAAVTATDFTDTPVIAKPFQQEQLAKRLSEICGG